MAIAHTAKTSGNSSTDATSYATASITPGTSELELVAVVNSKGTTPDTPTITGYTQVATVTYASIAAPQRRVTLLRYLNSSPSAGALTIDFAGATQTGCAWAISDFSGVDTGGSNGANAVVQSATNRNDDASGNDTLTVKLAAFGDAVNNATYGAFSQASNNGFDIGTGFTQIHDTAAATPQTGIFTEFKLSGDTTVDATDTGASDIAHAGIAIEIKVAPPASTVKTLAVLGVG